MATSVLTRSVRAEEISALLKEEESAGLFLRLRYEAELNGRKWAIWHPVADSSSDKKKSVAVRFSDGTVNVTLKIGEEVEVAIVQDLQVTVPGAVERWMEV